MQPHAPACPPARPLLLPWPLAASISAYEPGRVLRSLAVSLAPGCTACHCSMLAFRKRLLLVHCRVRASTGAPSSDAAYCLRSSPVVVRAMGRATVRPVGSATSTCAGGTETRRQAGKQHEGMGC